MTFKTQAKIARGAAEALSLRATIATEIERLNAEQNQLGQGAFRDERAPESSAEEAEERKSRMQALGMTISRLQQIQDWLQSDQRLLTMLDEYVGRHVNAQTSQLKRQNLLLSVAMTFVGAILGWLLSILLPASLLAGQIFRLALLHGGR